VSFVFLNGMSICPANRKNSRRAICPVTLNAHVKNRYLSSSRSPRPNVIRSDDRMMAENAEIEIGNKFSSYEELESKIRLYELCTNTEFYKRDSRTILSARKRGIKREIKSELKFYQLRYSCINGGKKHNSKSSGQRPKQR